jgi:large subunit ribosomal protein L15
MQLHTLKRKTPNKAHKIVGRGGKRGKTAGRGTKGQKARAGHRIRPEARDLIKKLPKLRGRGKNTNVSIQTKPLAVNVETLERYFSSGDTVTYKELLSRGIARGTHAGAKVLGSGELTKKLAIVGLAVSAEAKRKVEAAGGSVA